MKKLLCAALLAALPALAQLRPVNTFSIVARDPATGEMGVAVQSHWFAVGQIVPWAEAGVGAVATQSFVDPSYGKLGLDLLRAGKSAPAALRALLGGDAACEVRQVGMVDASGVVATFTGSRDIVAAGGIAAQRDRQRAGELRLAGGTLSVGRDFAVQANLMANDTVWPAMAKAYAETKGDLADAHAGRARCRAGGGRRHPRQAVGGADRGQREVDRTAVAGPRASTSASTTTRSRWPSCAASWPLQRAYNHMNAGDLAVEHKDNEAALREYSAAEEIAADDAPASRRAATPR